jgi:hypothetical protein
VSKGRAFEDLKGVSDLTAGKPMHHCSRPCSHTSPCARGMCNARGRSVLCHLCVDDWCSLTPIQMNCGQYSPRGYVQPGSSLPLKGEWRNRLCSHSMSCNTSGAYKPNPVSARNRQAPPGCVNAVQSVLHSRRSAPRVALSHHDLLPHTRVLYSPEVPCHEWHCGGHEHAVTVASVLLSLRV